MLFFISVWKMRYPCSVIADRSKTRSEGHGILFFLFTLDYGVEMQTLLRNFSRCLNFGSFEDKFNERVSVATRQDSYKPG